MAEKELGLHDMQRHAKVVPVLAFASTAPLSALQPHA